MPFSSRIPNFYDKSVKERREKIADLANLSKEEIQILKGKGVTEDIFNIMIENVVGSISLPLGIATNFIVNEKEYLIPMAIEESSVVAAASYAAKIAREKGGFSAEYSGSYVIGQIQVLGINDFEVARKAIKENQSFLLEIANSTNKILADLHGGAQNIEIRQVRGQLGDYMLIHLIVDVKDAMGANAVNTMLESLKPEIEKLTEGKTLLRIISNYALKRMVKVTAVFDKEKLGGDDVVNKILIANDLAENDQYRAVTHNKGIMNGITSVLLATGNDTRAVEAGVHAFAVKEGKYKSLTHYEKNEEGNLVGFLEIPLSVGILGGAISANPAYKTALKILSIDGIEEFSNVIAAVGLAQNLAALRALVTEGIQKGHMSLHARNIAMTAGAEESEIEEIAQQMQSEENISFDRAKEILKSKKK